MKRSEKRNKKKLRRNRRMTALFMVSAIFAVLLFSGKAALTAAAGTDESTRYKYYTSIEIQENTTLWEIAETYRTEEYDSIEAYIDEVMEVNHLEDDQIYAGAYICIPYYSSELK